MTTLRRFAASFQRRHAAGRRAVRRRPRTSAAIGLLVLLAGVSGIGLLAAIAGAPPAATTTAPAFTVRGEWTLVELQRHIEAGEIDAITAMPATAANAAGELLVRTKSGVVVAIDLSVAAPDAVAALTSLGYGNLLTTEAIGVARPAAAATPASILATLVPLAMLAGVVLMIVLLSRRSRGTGRDRDSKFMTIMPRDPTATVAEHVPSVDGTLQPVVRITLADVAGCDEAKLELTEAIEFLKTPERFRRLGARIPRGIMLYGPPGTGKTMLARAVAAEAGVPFHYASGSEFVEKYVGVGAKRIRDLFAQARKLGRGVIFFDEFDAIGKARGGPNSNEEREQTLNQLLVELDGFGSTDDVIVIAATNRLDVLDAAVLRPGRFTRKIHVGMPDVKGRRAILDVHARNKPLAAATDLEVTARKTYGFSGAMLADLLNEAAILAARRGADVIDPEDVHAGWLKVAVGSSRRRSMDDRERSIIAAHEVGHAICGKVHGDKRRVEEISLFAHGDALGVTVSSQEDNDLPSESDLRARLVALMGGRAAEEILFHEVTGGASNDFEAANRIATVMVTQWGMGRDPEATDGGVSGRGVLSFFVPAGDGSLPLEIRPAATRAVRAILDEAYAEASRTLIAHLDTLRRLAAYLVEHERVDGTTFDELFDGRIEVPTAGDEWRPATARPRAWGEVVDLADRRLRAIVPTIAATAIVSAVEPTADQAARIARPDEADAARVAVAVVPLPGPAAPLAGTPDRAIVPGSQPADNGRRWRRVRGASGSSGQRVRRHAAGLLQRAGRWLQGGEPEAERL